MKLTKKIIVAVLALALLASCFVSSAFATDVKTGPSFSAEGITKLDDILEYYACDDYIAENYEDASDEEDYGSVSLDNPVLEDRFFEFYDCTDYEMYEHVTQLGVAANPTDASDKVLAADLGVDDYIKYSRSSTDGKAWTEKVFLTFDVYFDDTCMSNAYLEVRVKLEGKAFNSILKFDFGYGDSYYNDANPDIKGPVVWYAPWDAKTKNFSTKYATIEGFEPKVDTWYSVTVCFNAEDEVCSFDIAEGEESVASVSYEIPGAKGISAFECKSAFMREEAMWWEYEEDPENPLHALMYLDDVEIYEGSYKRTPSKKEEIANTTLNEIKAYFLSESCSAEEKLVIADVFYELLGYDEASILSYVAEAWEYVNLTYANEIISRVNNINTANGYYERVAYVENQVVPYDAKIEAGVVTELIGVSEEVIAQLNTARTALQAEKDTLETIKTHSEGFIVAINAYDPANVNYDEIVGYYTEAIKDDYKLRAADYAGMAEAEAIFADIEYKYDRMVADVNAVIAAVDAMKAAEANFGAYFTAYQTAKIAYYKYDEMPEYANGAFITPDADMYATSANAEYIPSEKVTAARASIEYFNEKEPVILADAALCDAFNMAVLKAYASDYFPTTETLIEDAYTAKAAIADRIEYFNDYKGIEAGKTLADSVIELDAVKAGKKDEKLAASALYIEAVNAIATAEGFYAKRDAVKAALKLKAAGDNLAVTGVLEANLALTAAEAEVNNQQGNSESVISLVKKIDSAKTISERRALIRQINEHIGGVANDYKGVTEAVATFNAFVEAFKADVAAANAALESAVKNAVKF